MIHTSTIKALSVYLLPCLYFASVMLGDSLAGV